MDTQLQKQMLAALKNATNALKNATNVMENEFGQDANIATTVAANITTVEPPNMMEMDDFNLDFHDAPRKRKITRQESEFVLNDLDRDDDRDALNVLDEEGVFDFPPFDFSDEEDFEGDGDEDGDEDEQLQLSDFDDKDDLFIPNNITLLKQQIRDAVPRDYNPRAIGTTKYQRRRRKKVKVSSIID